MAIARVLIVDDSNAMRKVLALALRKAGATLAEVWEAGNGQEALDLLAEKTPDLILCDINMPVMDGLEFVHRLHAQRSAGTAPIVMVTTEGSESKVVEAVSHGARGYIRKPFTQEQFRDCVLPLIPAAVPA
jgi:two-component system chemotaxis response regulator CheY